MINDPTLKALADLGAKLHTQDNRLTNLPIFFVQSRHRVYDVSADQATGVEFRDADHQELDDDTDERAMFDSTGRLPDGVSVLYVLDVWVNVMPFLTHDGAMNYIVSNAGVDVNLREYVASGYGNPEWELLRDMLLDLGGYAIGSTVRTLALAAARQEDDGG